MAVIEDGVLIKINKRRYLSWPRKAGKIYGPGAILRVPRADAERLCTARGADLAGGVMPTASFVKEDSTNQQVEGNE